MSYTQNYSFRIYGTASGSVSYPASEHGGTTSASFPYSEDVYVDINVDTNPVDESVGHCKNSVDMLTGSVVAMKLAYVQSKIECGRQIARTLSKGFMSLIRQEIAQQMAQIGAKIPTLSVELRARAQSLRGKSQQMQADHERISSRYATTFNQLDEELRASIFLLDKDAVKLHANMQSTIGATVNDRTAGSVITLAETSGTSTDLTVGNLKHNTLETIDGVKDYIQKAHGLEKDINDYLTKTQAQTSSHIYVPVLITQFEAIPSDSVEHGSICAHLPAPLIDNMFIRDRILQDEPECAFRAIPAATKSSIETHFKRRVSGYVLKDPTPNNQRVARQALQLWMQQTTLT